MKADVLVPLAVRRTAAAAMLSMSIESFERYVQPELKMIQAGTLWMVPVSELERYVADNACIYGGAAR